jgi:predicted lipoprotein with Yx(FWY)xxD motif
MKKRILLFTAVAGFCYLAFSSHSAGPAASQYDCSGADVNTSSGNPAGCSTGGGCHALTATAGINVVIELDSAGVVASSTAGGTGHYKPGFTYQVKITGTNTTSNSLPKWGFQVAATKGATASSTTSTSINAGTLQSTGLPTGLSYWAAPGSSSTFYANVVGHNMRLSPASGTGGSGTTYIDSFTWTAPAAGTGVVSVFGALNAVNDSGGADAGDLWNIAHLVLNEITTSTSVTSISNNISITAFPNPVKNELNLQIDNAGSGTYSYQVFDLMGNSIANGNIDVNGPSNKATINTGNWAYGTYNVVIEKDGIHQVQRVVKL